MCRVSLHSRQVSWSLQTMTSFRPVMYCFLPCHERRLVSSEKPAAWLRSFPGSDVQGTYIKRLDSVLPFLL